MKTDHEFSFEVLVTTMNQKDLSKYKEMNLQTNAIIANQSDTCDYIEKKIDSSLLKMITTNTRGLSINRNIAIMYSTADYIMFADDDQVFVDGYLDIIKSELQKAPKADAIKFYCQSMNRPLSFKQPKKLKRVGKREIMSAGVVALVVKRQFLINNALFFQLNMGAGSEFFLGEDSAFYSDFIEKKGKIFVSPKLISHIDQSSSTWFKGVNEDFLKCVGYSYARIYKRFATFAAIRRAVRTKKTEQLSFVRMIRIMREGIRKQREDK